MRKVFLFVAGASLLAGASAYRGFLILCCHFANYDDTGFMLTLIQGFNKHGSLYRETFSQYGPFFSEFYWFVGRILSVPITHDGIRLVVLILWVGSSVAAGALAYRIAQSVWAALLVQAVSFHVLDPLAWEPGHPISLVAALLGALALVANSMRENKESRTGALLLGTILGLLTMTKINLGVFAIAAVGTAWAYCSPPDLLGRLLRWTAAFSFGALGALVVKPTWPAETRFSFVALFLCTLAAVLVSARDGKIEWPVLRRFGIWTLGAFFLSVALSLSGAFLSGTRWSDLVRGLIVQPMALGDVFIVPPGMQRKDAIVALFSLLAASGWWLLRTAPLLLQRWIDLALRVLFVGVMTAWLMGLCALWTMLIFVWIAALPPVFVRQTEPDLTRFGRLSLVLLAVGQFLGMYPVSGAQIAIPAFFTSLCLIPVLHGLFLNWERADLFRFHHAIRLALPIVVLAAPALTVANYWREYVQSIAGVYHTRASLNLPGARLLRLDPADAAVYRCLAENLRHSRPSFLTLPGMNSFYGWAERPTPTGFNTTMNFALLTDAEQHKIVEVARGCKPIALVFNPGLMFDFWIRGRFQARGPLVDFAKTECRSAGSVRGYHLLSLNSEPLPLLTYCATVKAGLPNESSRITVTVPGRLGNVTAASLRNLTAPESPRKFLPLEARQAVPSEPRGEENLREFSFPNPDPSLARETLDQFMVQLWNEAGEWVADLPFAHLPDERQNYPGR